MWATDSPLHSCLAGSKSPNQHICAGRNRIEEYIKLHKLPSQHPDSTPSYDAMGNEPERDNILLGKAVKMSIETSDQC